MSDNNSLESSPEKSDTSAISMDSLLVSIRQSTILNNDNCKQLAMVADVPFINPAFHDDRLKNIIQYYSINPDEMEMELHIYAKELLAADKVNEAWQVLLAASF